MFSCPSERFSPTTSTTPFALFNAFLTDGIESTTFSGKLGPSFFILLAISFTIVSLFSVMSLFNPLLKLPNNGIVSSIFVLTFSFISSSLELDDSFAIVLIVLEIFSPILPTISASSSAPLFEGSPSLCS